MGQGDQHGTCHKEEGHHEKQGHRIHGPAQRQSPLPVDDALPATKAGDDHHHQHPHRHRLHPSGGRTGGAADKHEDTAHHDGVVGHGPLIDHIEARRPESGGLEEGVEAFLSHPHGTQGSGVGPLRPQEEDGPAQGEGRRQGQHQAAIQSQFFPMAVLQPVLPHKKAQTANDDQGGGGEKGQGVVLEPHQAGEGAGVPSLEVKARITEGGYRVEKGMPHSLEKAVLGDHPKGQHSRPQKFKKCGAHESVTNHPHHPVQVVQVQSGHHDEPLRQPDAPVGRQGDEGDHRHEPQTPQLDEKEDHPLPKGRPGEKGVGHHKPGDTGGRGGGKEGGKQALALPGTG